MLPRPLPCAHACPGPTLTPLPAHPLAADFRDFAPPQLGEVHRLYEPVVQQGRWTEGLLQMWLGKNKPVKRAVHIPCWDSFCWNPLRWRGIVLGR